MCISKEVVDDFSLVLDLIIEMEASLTSDLNYIRLIEDAKELAVRENTLFDMKIAKMKEMMDKLQHPMLPKIDSNSKQLSELTEFISTRKTINDIVMVESKLMKIGKLRNKQIIDKPIENVSQAVKESLVELSNLKNGWNKLLLFFNKV